MTRRGICPLFLITLLAFGGVCGGNCAGAAEAPDFREVYDLVKQHAAGVTEAELNQAAVQGFLSALDARAFLGPVGSSSGSDSPVVLKGENLDGFTYVRIGRIGEGLASAVRATCSRLTETNKLKGIVLDLRYAGGGDYGAVVETADLFVGKERPLLDWGQGMVSAKGNRDAYKVPVAILVNGDTAGAAEALAGVLRESGVGLVLGSKTAGRAMVYREFPLKGGEKLQIGVAPVRLGDGTALGSKGVDPDIKVDVSAANERAYYEDPFRFVGPTNQLTLARAGGGTPARRARFGEAELVRERREGGESDTEAVARRAEPDAPVVYDPALARALDLLKGLYVVRQGRS